MQSPSNINTLKEQIHHSVFPNAETAFHLHPYPMVISLDVEWTFLEGKIMKTYILLNSDSSASKLSLLKSGEFRVTHAGDFESVVQEFATLSLQNCLQTTPLMIRKPCVHLTQVFFCICCPFKSL